MARAVASQPTAATSAVRLRRFALIVVVLLLVQFALGMAVNLFVTIPAHHPGAGAKDFFTGMVQSVTWAILHGTPALVLHAVLGLILVLGAIQGIVLGFRGGSRACRWSAVLGFLFALGAGFNGGSFLNYGHNVNSYLMSIGFAASLACYVLILFLLAGPATAG